MQDTGQRSVVPGSERIDLAARMVQTLPSFGEWATAVRDFETPHGKLGYRQAAILYGLRHGLIADGPVSPSLLADYFGVQPSVITRVLVRLDKSGFISRRTDPIDRRGQSVQITDLGTAISVYIENLFVGEMLDSMAFASDAELDTLRESLPILIRIAADLDDKRRRSRPTAIRADADAREDAGPD